MAVSSAVSPAVTASLMILFIILIKGFRHVPILVVNSFELFVDIGMIDKLAVKAPVRINEHHGYEEVKVNDVVALSDLDSIKWF